MRDDDLKAGNPQPALTFLYTKIILVYQISREDRVGRTEAAGEPRETRFDFADVVHFEWETALITATHSRRLKAVGRYADGTAVVIYAELGAEAISIVSFRPANARERKLI